ncbi:oligosaccharide flippase family protein [Yersinia enterocolitica]|uniref:oligosaccharide flippase family protein n=1 Tax=Yersinia enterocolitica TaxID=630 RepID=UPI00094BB3EE|nr:oligosaccharide flippase family protein [Yersinia enterocolitica]MBW5832581.1 oligosaccharide flippase family protein [Yersinia enterocolitica]MBX9475464.1 oligosaccharide flippase family protein [Yersinia enterocolitica]MBX9487835.1 oligosaccharide flippase family protein [Yersinia enterocolitica]MBX9493377.1 oligosaccharide flippase family protein [Yersinia enterocolitica]HEN3612902.1 oligosaccharide flippase family protein [Yersinia enterocolitica]
MSVLRRNIFSLFILQGSNYFITLLTLPYLTRVLGVEGFGIYSLTISIAQYFVIFIDFGFNLSASKRIAEHQDEPEYISRIFFETIYAKLILCLISIAGVMILVSLNAYSVIRSELIYTIIMLIGTVLMPIWFFQGIEKLAVVTKLMIFSRLALLPLFFIFVRSDADVKDAIIIQSSLSFLAGLVALIYIYKQSLIKIVKLTNLRIGHTLKDSLPIFIAVLSNSLYTMSTTIIIGIFSNVYEVSIFTAADRMKGAILGVFLILGNAFYPRINALLVNNKEQAYSLIRKIFYWQGALCMVIIIFVISFSKLITQIMFGPEYSAVSDLLILFSPVYFLVLQSAVLGNYILLTHGYKKAYTILPIASAIIHIPLCAYLASKYGAWGGIISIVTAEAVTLALLILILKRKKLLSEVLYKIKLN